MKLAILNSAKVLVSTDGTNQLFVDVGGKCLPIGGGGGGGGGLPTGGAAHQQLVTDKDGNAKWEDRLCYSEQIQGEVLPETELTDTGDSIFALLTPPTTMPVVGVNHTVVYNGASYDCVAEKYSEDDGQGNIVAEGVLLGNTGAMSGEIDPAGPPFLLMIANAPYEGMYAMGMALDGSETFTISININGEYTKKIDSKFVDQPDLTPFVVTVQLAEPFDKSYNGQREDLIYLSHTKKEVLKVIQETNRPIFCHVIANINPSYSPTMDKTKREHFILPLTCTATSTSSHDTSLNSVKFESAMDYIYGFAFVDLSYYDEEEIKTNVRRRLSTKEVHAQELSVNNEFVLYTTGGKLCYISVTDDGQLITRIE